MLVLIRGAGDLASGIALRLRRAGYAVVMTELAHPTTIRRTVAFSDAVVHGSARVEEIEGRFAADTDAARRLLMWDILPVLIDPEAVCRTELRPEVLVDAILAKRNLGTTITDASVVIGVGPGFTVGMDCHAVVETMRGHSLGRAYYGVGDSPLPNTAIPGLIGGYTGERVLRAPAAGLFQGVREIGDQVHAGEIVGFVGDVPMRCTIDGVLRGILADGVPVHPGMKAGDVDPRGRPEYCHTVSDKALAIGGGVLEAILHLTLQCRQSDGHLGTNR